MNTYRCEKCWSTIYSVNTIKTCSKCRGMLIPVRIVTEEEARNRCIHFPDRSTEVNEMNRRINETEPDYKVVDSPLDWRGNEPVSE